MRLLVVEDNEELGRLLVNGMRGAGFDADFVASASEARAALMTTQFTAVVLDLGLPDCDGLHVLREIRSHGNFVPVVVLTARASVADRVRGLEAGADDYLAKPFALEELVARLRAVLRRPGQLLGSSLQVGNMLFDTGSRQLTIDNAPRVLSARECAVLELLMRREGRIVPKKLLEDQIFGLSGEGGPNAIEVYIYRLRKQLSEWKAKVHIQTVRGVGYLIAEEE
jgi:DNA-binding response OmpR family regulator